MENPILKERLSSSSKLKELIIDFVGEETKPENDEVTVGHIVEVFSQQFPEFVLALAEENFIRGYSQAISDLQEDKEKKNVD